LRELLNSKPSGKETHINKENWDLLRELAPKRGMFQPARAGCSADFIFLSPGFELDLQSKSFQKIDYDMILTELGKINGIPNLYQTLLIINLGPIDIEYSNIDEIIDTKKQTIGIRFSNLNPLFKEILSDFQDIIVLNQEGFKLLLSERIYEVFRSELDKPQDQESFLNLREFEGGELEF